MRVTLLGLLVLMSCLAGCRSFPVNTPARMLEDQATFETRLSMARSLEREGNYVKAREICQQLLAKDPYNPQLHHRLGVIAIKQGMVEEGLASLQRARMGAPKDAEVLTDIGYALYLQEQLDEAAGVLRDALKADPDNRRTINNLALVTGRQGQMAQAQQLFRQVGDDAETHANLAFIYAQRGELDEAERHYSRALDYDDDLRVAAEALVELAQRRGAARVSEEGLTGTRIAASGKTPGREGLTAIDDASQRRRMSREEFADVVKELRESIEANRKGSGDEEFADAESASSRNVQAHFHTSSESAGAKDGNPIELTGANLSH